MQTVAGSLLCYETSSDAPHYRSSRHSLTPVDESLAETRTRVV